MLFRRTRVAAAVGLEPLKDDALYIPVVLAAINLQIDILEPK